MRWTLALPLGLLLFPPVPDLAAQEVVAVSGSRAATARLVRDRWGVPHCLSESDYGATFAYGWAIAEDRLVDALSAIWTAQGRRTEIDGAGALGLDRAHRLLRMSADVERAWRDLPEEVRAVGQGYADGLNAYMAAHSAEVPEWAESVRPEWPMAAGRMICFIPQIRRANRDLRGIAPPLAVLSTGTDDVHYDIAGSNAWAVGAERMREGHAVLLGDPHLPWKHEFRLHETHIRGGTFEVAGAAFLGVPLPVLARNRDVAWSWTWNGPDHADAYRIPLDPDDPERYRFGEEWLSFEKERHAFRMPDGGTVEETLRWSVHGPVVHVDREQGYAAAVRLSSFGQTGLFEQIGEMTRARDLDELEAAMSRMQFGHFNLVAADSSGSVEYVWQGRVPRRAPGHDYQRPLDGSDPATLWSATDVVAFEELPRVRDPESGWVQNCNNTPEKTTGSASDPQPAEWAPHVVGDSEDTLRAWYTRRWLGGAEAFDEDEALALATDGRMIPHSALVAQLEHAWLVFGDEYESAGEIAGAVETLLDWDGWPDLASGAPTLFTVWLFTLRSGRVFLPVEWMERPLDEVDEAWARRLFDALRDARRSLAGMAAGLTTVPWGLVHVIRLHGRTFPVESGMYPAISLMNANLHIGEHPDLGSLSCSVGSSYTALHVMSDPPRSYSVLPLGQTVHRDKPYATAMTELFAQRRLKPLPLTDAQIEAEKLSELVFVIRAPEER